MSVWLASIKRKHIHISALTIIVLAILGVLLLAALSLRYYFFLGTNFGVSFVGRDAILRFSLSDADKENLANLTKSLHLDWQGQDLSVELPASDISKWQGILPSSGRLSFPTSSVAILHATTKDLPISPLAQIGSQDRFVPKDAVAVFSTAGLNNVYSLPGKEVFSEVSARPTLAFFYINDKLSLVFAAPVKNQADLDGKLNALKNNPGTPVLGYSSVEGVATGFSETDLGGIKTYTLTRPELKYQPTFGDFQGILLVASSPEAWQAAQAAYQSGTNLRTNQKYQEALFSAPKFGSGLVYLDLTALAGRGQKISADLAPFANLKIDDSWFLSGFNTGKMDSLTAAWFGLSPTEQGQGQSSLWVRLKSR